MNPLTLKIPKNYKIRYKGFFDETCSECDEWKWCCWHHLIHGKNRRTYSDYYDLVKPVCIDCHDRIHHLHELDNKYKIIGQEMFEEEYTRQDFGMIFGRNYIL